MEKKQLRFSVWYFVGAFLLLLLAHTYLVQEQTHQVSYSEFKALLATGKLADVSLGPDYVTAKLATQDLAGVLQEQQIDALKRTNAPALYVRAVRVEDPKLVEELEAAKVPYSGRLASTWVTELASWVGSLVFFVVLWMLLFRRMGSAGGGLMAIGKSKAKVYVENEMRTTFEDVAGAEEAKEELKEVVQFLKAPEKFRRLGGNIPKGVLLVGAPGTGKTLLARAVAGEAKVPFFSMSGSEFVEMFVGVGAARVRDLFEQAKQKAPCIVFVDELDALGKARGMNPFGGHDEREQTLNQLLVEMDGFDPSGGVIIMAATNRPEILDAALLRAGRFDRHVAIDRPDIKAREAILRVHSKNVKLGPDVDLALIAQRTPGLVGSDLANIVNESALLAARYDREQVTMKEFDEAVDRVTVGLEKKTRVMSQREKRIVAYHETGHALMASLLPNNEPVRKISIIPRGVGALGYTQQLPTEDRYLMTRSELDDRLCILLGGRVAEEIVFGDVSTGAHDDLQKASDIAVSMVTQYGMSETLGLRAFDRERRSPFLDGSGPIGSAKDYSEESAAAIDAEVARILDKARDRVRVVLSSRRDLLEVVAQRLLDREVIEGDDLRGLIRESGNQTAAAAS